LFESVPVPARDRADASTDQPPACCPGPQFDAYLASMTFTVRTPAAVSNRAK
jgi:hypothetical protein